MPLKTPPSRPFVLRRLPAFLPPLSNLFCSPGLMPNAALTSGTQRAGPKAHASSPVPSVSNGLVGAAGGGADRDMDPSGGTRRQRHASAARAPASVRLDAFVRSYNLLALFRFNPISWLCSLDCHRPSIFSMSSVVAIVPATSRIDI